MLLQRIREDLSWRWQLAHRKRFLRREFQNGEELIESYLDQKPCATAVCRDGTVIRHPNRAGLAQTILEVWFDEVYTGSFYRPRPGDILIDAGANIGLFSLWVARTYPGCRVFAFEPFAENYQLLTANLEAAEAKDVTPWQRGLSGTSGYATMCDGGRRSLDHRLEMLAEDSADSTTLQTNSFADVVQQAGEPIALFKCDIEGSEYDLFANASDNDLASVARYAMEYHDHLRPGTLDLLQRRLGATHDVTVRPESDDGYGMLYATRRADRP